VADDPSDDQAKPAASDAEPQARTEPSFDPRYLQRNLANRLFPGPSRLMSNQTAQHIEGLLKSGDGEAITRALRERRGKGGNDAAPRPPRGAVDSRPPAANEPPPATADDIAKFQETLDQQNELLRAILASTVDTQTDARATAQNSRTFAWAGTAIALLTLIATVLSIVAAVNAN
jgi:hypothetical protein